MNGNTTKFASLGLAIMVVLSVFAGSLAFVGGAVASSSGLPSDSDFGDATTVGNNSTINEDGTANVSSDGIVTKYYDVSSQYTATDVKVQVSDVQPDETVVVTVNNSSGDTVTSFNISQSNGLGGYASGSKIVSVPNSTNESYQFDIRTTSSSSYVTLQRVEILGNSPPTADAGADQIIESGGNITFNGTASSDPDGDNLTLEWDVDDDGEYELTGESPSVPQYLTGVPDGYSETVTLRVTDEHGATSTDTMTVTVAEATYTHNFDVTDANGSAVTNASIEVIDDADGSLVETLTTDVDGLASVELADGNYSATVSADGYVIPTVLFEVSGASGTHNVTLDETTEEPATYDVDFSVVDNETEVENASIVVTDENGTEVANLSTDANGSAVTSLEDGTYAYTISADGYDDVSGEVVVDGAAQSVSGDFADDDDDSSGGGFVPSNGASIAIVVVLILAAALVASKEEQ